MNFNQFLIDYSCTKNESELLFIYLTALRLRRSYLEFMLNSQQLYKIKP